MSTFALPILVLLAYLLAIRLATRGNYRNLSPGEALPLVKSGTMYILDVRTVPELAGGCLPGAHSIPLNQIRQRMAEIPKGPILVYCASGMRSRRAASMLSQAGHQEIVNLAGGFLSWNHQGLPVAPRSA